MNGSLFLESYYMYGFNYKFPAARPTKTKLELSQMLPNFTTINWVYNFNTHQTTEKMNKQLSTLEVICGLSALCAVEIFVTLEADIKIA